MIGTRVSRADRSSVVEGLVMASVRAEAGRGSPPRGGRRRGVAAGGMIAHERIFACQIAGAFRKAIGTNGSGGGPT
jgi:hypothetical protein